ncbi:MAG: beta-galactosidase trimerization domain-containing protein, partial [Clostridia bacterium]|nr:beta-galactosidase trimerization domain-containing protein [Clostridia bacterium]
YAAVVRERITELIFNYDVDGLFLDITYFRGGTCFCKYCKSEFMKMYGYELRNDISPGTPEYMDFNEFKRATRAMILTTIADTVKEIKNIPVIWNGSGSIYLAEPETDSFSDYLTTEFHAPDYLDGIIRAKWMQSRGKGFIMSTPSELGSWGDWTMVPGITLKSVVCSIAAHGGGVYYNHTPYPSGPFAQSHIPPLSENISEAFEYLESFEEYLRGTESCADTAILFSVESKRFWENGFGSEEFEYFKSLKGAVKMLLASGKPFDIIDETRLEEDCPYKTVLLPGVPYVGDETLYKLETFINKGGNILASGEFALYDESGKRKDNLPELTGCRLDGYSGMSIEYITGLDGPLKTGIPDMPILIKKAGMLPDIIAVEAGVLANKCKPPFEAKIDRHVYHQHAHPFEITEYASISQNKHGLGKFMYIPADIFRSYYETASPWLMKLVHNCLYTMDNKPLLVIEAPECAYPTILESEKGYLLQIININGPITEPAKVFPTSMLKIQRINIHTTIDFKKAGLVVSDRETILEKNGMELTLTNVGLHTAIFLEK